MKIITKLYKGDVTISFDPFKHAYWLNDEKKLKSVTSYLKVIDKPQLVPWAARVAVEAVAEKWEPGKGYSVGEINMILRTSQRAHYEKRDRAGDKGTIVHEWIDEYIKGNDPGMPKDPEIKGMIEAFLEWVKLHKVKFHLSEQVVYSKKYGFVGTADFICSIDGKLYLGDNKTSKGVYLTHYIQSAAYRYARAEEFPEEEYHGQVVLHLRDGKFRALVSNDDEIYMEMVKTFLFAQKLSEGLEDLEKFKAKSL